MRKMAAYRKSNKNNTHRKKTQFKKGHKFTSTLKESYTENYSSSSVSVVQRPSPEEFPDALSAQSTCKCDVDISNDLSNSTADRCISDMKDILSCCKEKHPSASIHVLPAFVRVNEGNFNGRVKLFNEDVKTFCAKDHN